MVGGQAAVACCPPRRRQSHTAVKTVLRALLPLVGFSKSTSTPLWLRSPQHHSHGQYPSEKKAITVSYTLLTQKYQDLVLEFALAQLRISELETIISRQTQDLLAADQQEREWQSQKQSHAAELAGEL